MLDQMTDEYKEKLTAFTKLVLAHDLTYEYSDDHRAYSNGLYSYAAICKAARDLKKADANKIWNAVVDQKVVEKARDQFYW